MHTVLGLRLDTRKDSIAASVSFSRLHRQALALAAALAPLCAATAAPLDNTGPHTLKQDQPACQNLLDVDDIAIATTSRDGAKLGDPSVEERKRHCMILRNGTVVTVKRRPSHYECVEVKGRSSTACYYTAKVSRTTLAEKEPTYSWCYD